MNQLLILGAGGHGKVVAETALASNEWDKIAFLDDAFPSQKRVLSWSVLGILDDANGLIKEYPDLAVAIGQNALRLRLINHFSSLGFKFPNIVHPTALVSPSVKLGKGIVVFPKAVVNAESHLGSGCIINTSSTIDHDCRISDGVHICPGVNMAGGVSVGEGSLIGIGSSIIQQIRIGSNTTVGAGSVVISDIGDNVTAFGNPAREQGNR
jgi:sugar O-acyltransferase (sialic acid O-acetyltransferase NeuD family)